jgi:hypothetical protein
MRSISRTFIICLASVGLIGAAPVEQRQVYAVALAGTAIPGPAVGGPGDPDARGKVRITIDASRKLVCYDFSLAGVSTPLMAHIHRGPAYRIGPSVVTLFTGPGGPLDDCLLWTPKQLAAIVADPANHYVSLYTLEFPDGAVRGQLG